MYFLQHLHKNLQRLSTFALCVHNASLTRGTNAVHLSENYKDYIALGVQVNPENIDRVTTYISERALVNKYDEKTVEDLRKALLSRKRIIESQDWFLSEPGLRSSTGGEREQSYVQTVIACQELGLLQGDTFVLTSYGLLIKEIAKKYGVIDGPRRLERNPFIQNIPYVITAFLPVIKNDLLFQKNLLTNLPVEFSFSDVCILMEDILIGLDRNIPNTITTRSIKERIKGQIIASRKLNQKLKGGGWSKKKPDKTETSKVSGGNVSIQTLYRPFEDMLLPRLEFLVDMGALDKREPWRYNYSKTSKFEIATKFFSSEISFLDRYFSLCAALFERQTHIVTKSELIDHLRLGHNAFKNLAGYAPILEATVYANILSWEKAPWPVIEIKDSFKILGEMAREDNSIIRIGPDRQRQPFTFKIEGG
ncbi:hypothetical protein ACFLXC_00115 [Chloroflexota bacterium]